MRLVFSALFLSALTTLSVAGGPAWAETRSFDKNGDGKPDKWADFPGTELPSEIRYDRNYDGVVDEWELLTNGRMSELREDRNFDGKPDRIVSYKGGKPWFKKVDEDYDGHFDRLIFYDGSEDVRTASPELVRLLAEESGNAPARKKVAAPRRIASTRAHQNQHRSREPALRAPDYQDFFQLDDPDIKLPRLGGADPAVDWRIEHDRSEFRSLVPSRNFELLHEPSGGTFWVERAPRAEMGIPVAEILAERMEALSGAVRRRGMAAQRAEEKVRTPFGRGLKRVFHVSEGGHSQQVTLYVLVGSGDIVYVRTSCPVNGCGEFSRLSDAMVFGLNVAAIAPAP